MIDSGDDAFCVLTLDAGFSGALAADGDVERLIALISQFLDGDVLTDFDTGADLDTQLTDDVDLSSDDVLLELVGRDAVDHHTAGFVMFLEDGGFVTLGGEVVGSGQTGRTGADDSDLLAPFGVLVGSQNDFGDEAGDGFVDGAAGTGFFALAVTDTTADCRERVLSLDQLKSFIVAAFLGHLQVTLDGDVRRAGGLTGSGTGSIGLFTVLVSVVRGPAIFEPDVIGGIVTEFIGLLGTVFAFQLLTEFDGTGRAILDAAAAGHAVLRVDLRGVSGSGEVRSVEQHGGTKRVTDLDVAVAKSKDLVRAVDVGRLMDETVVFGDLQDAHDFVSVDVVAGPTAIHQWFGSSAQPTPRSWRS